MIKELSKILNNKIGADEKYIILLKRGLGIKSRLII